MTQRVTYTANVFDATGLLRYPNILVTAFDVGLKEKSIMQLNLGIDTRQFNVSDFTKDFQVILTRESTSGASGIVADSFWLVRGIISEKPVQGPRKLTLRCVHANDLLRRRIIAYDSYTTFTAKIAAADDMMKALVRENFSTAATDTTRRWDTTIFDVAADTTDAPETRRTFERENIWDVLASIALDTEEQGTYLGYECVNKTGGGALFQTYITARGVDRTATSAGGTVFRSLENVVWETKWDDEITVAYTAGQGQNNRRDIRTVSNASLIAESPYGRFEGYKDASHVPQGPLANDRLNAEARALLEARSRIVRFQADLVETNDALFGVDYNWGDLISVIDDGIVYNCRVDPVHIRYENGFEQKKVRLTNDFLGGA